MLFLFELCICRLVKPGGILVYSTCSIDPEENEERVASFLLRHPVLAFILLVPTLFFKFIIVSYMNQSIGISFVYRTLKFQNLILIFNHFMFAIQEFDIDPVSRYVPCNFVTEHGFYLSNPVKHSLDGAFAARLVRSR